jgi:hypothetical protein
MWIWYEFISRSFRCIIQIVFRVAVQMSRVFIIGWLLFMLHYNWIIFPIAHKLRQHIYLHGKKNSTLLPPAQKLRLHWNLLQHLLHHCIFSFLYCSKVSSDYYCVRIRVRYLLQSKSVCSNFLAGCSQIISKGFTFRIGWLLFMSILHWEGCCVDMSSSLDRPHNLHVEQIHQSMAIRRRQLQLNKTPTTPAVLSATARWKPALASHHR